jgi:prephenate dehydrogenase
VTRRAERFWKMLGATTVRMTPAAHDRAVGRISHLPHLLAALMVVAQKPSHLPLAGTGWLDTTRIASGDPAMWREIIMTNRQAVLAAIDDADEDLMNLRDLIELADGPGVERYLAAAKKRRDALLGQRLHRRQ